MALLLGIDLGTSYFKVGLFDEAGGMRGLGRVAVGKWTTEPGRTELPVDDFWRLLREGLGAALIQAKATASGIRGVSYSSQANTFVLLDERDEPLTPLVIWTDRRAHPIEPAVAEFGRSASFQANAGFAGLAAEFAPVKLRWFQQREPALWKRAARVMMLSDYFSHALTGERVGDASTAAFTGLYAVARGAWWTEALEFFQLSPAQLSRPLIPGTSAGKTGSRAASLLGLPAGIGFAVGALDHHAAAIGSGLDRLADASISTGTVLAALTLVPEIVPAAGCYHGPHLDGRQFYRLAFDPDGAGQLEEYQRSAAPQFDIARLAALAGETAPALSRTEIDCLAGERRHGAEIRRMMERISATHRRLLDRVRGGRPTHRVIATGGGARSAAWLQINADMINATVVVPRVAERACLGAAVFAAVAAGVHRDIPSALTAMVQPEGAVEPRPAVVALYRQCRED
jgi:sugar (pentulose or hexulose) kinase